MVYDVDVATMAAPRRFEAVVDGTYAVSYSLVFDQMNFLPGSLSAAVVVNEERERYSGIKRHIDGNQHILSLQEASLQAGDLSRHGCIARRLRFISRMRVRLRLDPSRTPVASAQNLVAVWAEVSTWESTGIRTSWPFQARRGV